MARAFYSHSSLKLCQARADILTLSLRNLLTCLLLFYSLPHPKAPSTIDFPSMSTEYFTLTGLEPGNLAFFLHPSSQWAATIRNLLQGNICGPYHDLDLERQVKPPGMTPHNSSGSSVQSSWRNRASLHQRLSNLNTLASRSGL